MTKSEIAWQEYASVFHGETVNKHFTLKTL